jgi:acyl carrier protein
MEAADDITQAIKTFIREEIAPDCDQARLDNNESLLDSGILDSFGIMALLAFIEEEFGAKIPADEIEPANFDTLGAIAALVARHR